jgi:hypothetical protein
MFTLMINDCPVLINADLHWDRGVGTTESVTPEDLAVVIEAAISVSFASSQVVDILESVDTVFLSCQLSFISRVVETYHLISQDEPNLLFPGRCVDPSCTSANSVARWMIGTDPEARALG